MMIFSGFILYSLNCLQLFLTILWVSLDTKFAEENGRKWRGRSDSVWDARSGAKQKESVDRTGKTIGWFWNPTLPKMQWNHFKNYPNTKIYHSKWPLQSIGKRSSMYSGRQTSEDSRNIRFVDKDIILPATTMLMAPIERQDSRRGSFDLKSVSEFYMGTSIRKRKNAIFFRKF